MHRALHYAAPDPIKILSDNFSAGQSLQALIVAISSGVIATILFFSATDMVKGNLHQLAAVEATQAGEVLFTLIGEVLFFSAALPTLISLGGMLLVIAGMILHSLASSKNDLVVVAQPVPNYDEH